MYQPREQVYYLWDKGNKLTLQQVQSPAFNKQFIHAGKSAISFGITAENMWFKIAVKNNIPDQQKEWIFEMAYPHFDSLEFYYQDEKGAWQKQLTGDQTPFHTRQIFNKHFAFPVHLSDTTTHTFYFHIGGQGSLQFPLYIQSPKTFYAAQEEISLIYGGMFFGTIIIMMLYNLFIFFSLKDKVYIYYVLTNFSVLIYYFGYTGYGFQYIWPELYWVNEKVIPFGAIWTGLTTVMFAKVFLETKKYMPSVHSIFRFFIAAYVIELLLLPFVSYEIALKGASLMASLSAMLVLVSSYLIWIKGNKSARFIAFAFSFYLIGILLLNLNITGIIHRNFFVAHAMEMGTIIEISLLSLALSDKYSRLKRQTEAAQAELIDVQRGANEELEKKIERRTQKINQQKSELEESNKVKDKLLSIISHDLKGPLNSFQTLLAMMLKDELTKDNINMYTSHLNNKLGLMINLVDNILNWVRTQMGGMKFDILELKIKEIVKENIHLFSSQAELKSIKITDEVPDDIKVLGDKNVVHMVIRNLVANALKFTKSDGQVFISARVQGNNVLIEVRDTGIGISPEKMKLLFTDAHFTSPDTNHNAGTGIGLLLCKEFLSKTSGKIWVDSEEDKGSSFKFTLPVA
ncbi:MAG: sensor histidine kinase, partial [Cytophagaceae bacterium]|nr:sensor histidine kinase [Cytophagaceae bacterium]